MRIRLGRKRANNQSARKNNDDDKVKLAKPADKTSSNKTMKLIRQVLNNPDLGYQVMVIIMALTSDQLKMDRRINTMSSSIESLRGITEVLNTSIRSFKTAAEAPSQIRKLIKPQGS